MCSTSYVFISWWFGILLYVREPTMNYNVGMLRDGWQSGKMYCFSLTVYLPVRMRISISS